MAGSCAAMQTICSVRPISFVTSQNRGRTDPGLVDLAGWVAGDRKAALEAYKNTLQKTAGVGLKMDIVFSMLRYAYLP